MITWFLTCDGALFCLDISIDNSITTNMSQTSDEKLSQHTSGSKLPSGYPKIPGLKPVFFVHVLAEEPRVIYSNKEETLTAVPLKGGSVQSIDPKYPFNAKITGGCDDIRSITGKPVGNLDCRVYLQVTDAEGKPKEEGAFLHYTGVVRFEGSVNEVVGKQKHYMEFEDGYVTCHPKIFLDAKTTESSWVNEENFIGKGRFLRDAENNLIVQYVVYAFE